MAGVLFLIAVLLFPILGLIACFRKISRQGELLREYGERLRGLEDTLRASPLTAGAAPPLETERIPEASPLPEAALAETAPAELSQPVLTGAAEPGDATLAGPPLAEPAPAEPTAPAAYNSLKAFIHGGNLWAAGGIILLLAGFATLITYLASRGFFTVEMGIAGAALSGLVMLTAGWRFRKKRPVYFLLLQGGGIGILYLSIFAAHKLTPYFPPLLTLILLSLLIPPALILALFQEAQPLALLGFLGGFAAPLLLASGWENHVFLFAYYGVLNLGILGIGLFRYWKGLNLLAFLSTFGLANYWAAGYYEASLFRQVEPFFLAYIIIFTILGIRSFEVKKIRGLDMILILGTPALGALLQWRVFAGFQHGHALVCIMFSAFYILLAFVLWKRRGGGLFSEAYLSLALFLANLALPLELAPRITSAVWAAEGALVFFFGLRLNKARAAVAGLILHTAAAIVFAFEQAPPVEGAFRSIRFTGALIIALSALVIIFIAEHPPAPSAPRLLYPAFPVVLAVWAFAWWFGGWSYEIGRALYHRGEVFFLFSSLSALAAYGGSRFFRTPVYRIGMIPSLLLGLYALLRPLVLRYFFYVYEPRMILGHNFFEGPFLWAWLAFFGIQALLLFLARKDLGEGVHSVWLFVFIVVTLGVLSSSGRALSLSQGLAPAWTSFAGLLPVFVTMIGISLLARRLRAPPSGLRWKLLFFVLPLVLSCIMGLWFLVTLFLPGNPAPLPLYIPILNPLDIEEAFCIVLFLLWQSALLKRKEPGVQKVALVVIIDTMVFLFTAAITARSVHFYGHIPYRRLFDSDVFQFSLFILWAVYGIGHIIGGNKLSLRGIWLAGAILTLTDIVKFLILDLAGTGVVTRIISFFIAGLLLLFIGWAAPLPPAKRKGALPGETENHDS
ncbi:MAG: DUF2339 domain-containing protein [Spirochaetaceae bacterium]|jgi:uncharacterized membrane protein|nr:DUF2339 domain-containing protein [Spirochaetaceae bacterium]